MKLVINPLPALKQAKKERVNQNFNSMTADNLHKDLVYTQKREWAKTADARLQPEADIRKITVEELSVLILSKPDNLSARELIRQDVMQQIEDAQTMAELDAVEGKTQ